MSAKLKLSAASSRVSSSLQAFVHAILTARNAGQYLHPVTHLSTGMFTRSFIFTTLLLSQKP